MKRYLFSLWENMAQSISARISICYYSSTRRKSPMSFESVIIKVGSSVVQISNVPTVDVHRTLRVTLIAWLLLPLIIAHAARLNPGQERRLDFLRKAKHLMKVKMSMRKYICKPLCSSLPGRTMFLVHFYRIF